MVVAADVINFSVMLSLNSFAADSLLLLSGCSQTSALTFVVTIVTVLYVIAHVSPFDAFDGAIAVFGDACKLVIDAIDAVSFIRAIHAIGLMVAYEGLIDALPIIAPELIRTTIADRITFLICC